jgi:hypothetical protein
MTISVDFRMRSSYLTAIPPEKLEPSVFLPKVIVSDGSPEDAMVIVSTIESPSSSS